MNKEEKLKILKRRLIELEEKAGKLSNDKNILANISNELNKKTNIKLNIILYDADLLEEISYLNDWIKFYEKKSARYENKIRVLEKEIQEDLEKIKKEAKVEKLIKAEAKEILEEKELKKEEIVKESINKKSLIKYAVPFVIILVVITSLFLLKPAITGHVVLNEETIYNESLNLKISESDTYEWNVKNPGNIKSLKASGSITGNGTVKVYIEKDGKKYLIYQNK